MKKGVNLQQDMTAAAAMLKGSGMKVTMDAGGSMERVMEGLSLSSPEEVMALVAMLDQPSLAEAVGLSGLAAYFQVSALEAMALVPAILSLAAKGCVKVCGTDVTTAELRVRPDVLRSVALGGEGCPVPAIGGDFDQFDLCSFVDEGVRSRWKGCLGTEDLLAMVQRMEEARGDLPMVSALGERVEDIADRVLFYCACRGFSVSLGERETSLRAVVNAIHDNPGTSARVMGTFLDGSNPLLSAGLLYLLGDRDSLLLSARALKLLYGDDAAAFLAPCDCGDRYDFVRRAQDLLTSVVDVPDLYSRERLTDEIGRLEDANGGLDFVAGVVGMVDSPLDRLLFYAVCDLGLLGGMTDLSYVARIYNDGMPAVLRDLEEGRHALQGPGLVAFHRGNATRLPALSLAHGGRALFLGKAVPSPVRGDGGRDVIECGKIAERNLFFDGDTEAQLSMLLVSLGEDNFRALRERLRERGLPTGVAVLLHGHPGTGKTEAVRQMARATGRDIMHVDIARTKSKWVGGSEKETRRVFARYRDLCRRSKLTPILLFNEADAVLSRRMDVGHDNLARMENAVQDIILEEMESFDGILMATTNLVDNLDAAFERRFLFKVRFDRPSNEARARMWKDKLPCLADDEAACLAAKFDLSGGEIDNIVRKVTIEEVLGGGVATLERIVELCGGERIRKGTARVGF